MNCQGRARVTLTIEMDLGDSWGGDCTVAQIHDQAAKAAVHQLRCGLVIDGLHAAREARQHARIVGEPKVEAILVERTKP